MNDICSIRNVRKIQINLIRRTAYYLFTYNLPISVHYTHNQASFDGGIQLYYQVLICPIDFYS